MEYLVQSQRNKVDIRSKSAEQSRYSFKVSGTKSIFVQSQRNGGLVCVFNMACIPQQNGRIESTARGWCGVDISRISGGILRV